MTIFQKMLLFIRATLLLSIRGLSEDTHHDKQRGGTQDETSLRETTRTGMCDTSDNEESISWRHCTISKSGENANRTIRRTAKAPRTHAPRTYNDETRKTKLHHTKTNQKTGTTTPQRPQHQKTNEHILAARLWDTFSIQPGRNIPKPAPIWPKPAGPRDRPPTT